MKIKNILKKEDRLNQVDEALLKELVCHNFLNNLYYDGRKLINDVYDVYNFLNNNININPVGIHVQGEFPKKLISYVIPDNKENVNTILALLKAKDNSITLSDMLNLTGNVKQAYWLIAMENYRQELLKIDLNDYNCLRIRVLDAVGYCRGDICNLFKKFISYNHITDEGIIYEPDDFFSNSILYKFNKNVDVTDVIINFLKKKKKNLKIMVNFLDTYQEKRHFIQILEKTKLSISHLEYDIEYSFFINTSNILINYLNNLSIDKGDK